MTPHNSCDVAIVGAGPVGLLLAGDLASGGVRVTVLERHAERSPVPKANGVVGHSALALAERGILAGTGLKVVSPPRYPFGSLSLNLGFGPGNPLHILPVPQRRLEQLLEDRATARGAEIARAREVVAFAQDDDGVTVDTVHNGATRRLTARYLVGCDGARSTVRKGSGIGFPGFTSDGIARIGRVVIPADRIRRVGDDFEIADVGRVVAMHSNPFPGGGFRIAPAAALDPGSPDDLYIVSTHEPRCDAVRDDGEPDPGDEVSIDELRASLRRVLGAELPFTDALWITATVGNSRQADAYRRGRIFLAGDAAHIFNAGGSALNIGLQDAVDLAARLTAALREAGKTGDTGDTGASAAGDPLDAYDETRRAACERALRHTRTQAALDRTDETGRALQETLEPQLTRRRASRELARLLEQA